MFSQPVRQEPLGIVATTIVYVASVGAGGLVALLVARQQWIEALAIIVLLPAVLVVQRYPLVTVGVWFAIHPFLSAAEDGGSGKAAVWLIHRLAPLASLVIVLVGTATKSSSRRLPRLGFAEVLMAGYVVASLLSILYASDNVVPEIRTLYTRTVIPMVLYLLVRFLGPRMRDLQRLAPILVFFLVTQALIGAMQWLAPGLLPSQWLSRAGTRTTGSLGQPGVFGTSAMFAGLLLLHLGISGRSKLLRAIALPAFIGSLILAALTFSRGTWLAATVVVIGVSFVYREQVKRVVAIGLVIVTLAGLSTALGPTTEYFERRFYSDQSQQSALGRLPVIIASVRMFEEKPLTGWGYGNFNRFDRQFQSSVDGLFVPEKDHSSHNLMLSIAAEQGMAGLVTYYGPVVYWLARTLRARRRLSSESAALMMILWMVVAAHLVVNNFAVMTASFGLGIWWISLGMIGVLNARAVEETQLRRDSSALQIRGWDFVRVA